MVAHFTQLHQDVDDAHEMPRRQRLFGSVSKTEQRRSVNVKASMSVCTCPSQDHFFVTVWYTAGGRGGGKTSVWMGV